MHKVKDQLLPKKLIQTRLHNPPESFGNCFPAVIASMLRMDSAEDCLQIQEHYDDNNWTHKLLKYLSGKGYEWGSLSGHTDGFYLVTGKTQRSNSVYHVCIYKDGKLWHDPHPDQSGLTSEEYFEYIKPIVNN